MSMEASCPALLPTCATNGTEQNFFFFKLLSRVFWSEGLDQTLTKPGAEVSLRQCYVCAKGDGKLLGEALNW